MKLEELARQATTDAKMAVADLEPPAIVPDAKKASNLWAKPLGAFAVVALLVGGVVYAVRPSNTTPVEVAERDVSSTAPAAEAGVLQPSVDSPFKIEEATDLPILEEGEVTEPDFYLFEENGGGAIIAVGRSFEPFEAAFSPEPTHEDADGNPVTISEEAPAGGLTLEWQVPGEDALSGLVISNLDEQQLLELHGRIELGELGSEPTAEGYVNLGRTTMPLGPIGYGLVPNGAAVIAVDDNRSGEGFDDIAFVVTTTADWEMESRAFREVGASSVREISVRGTTGLIGLQDGGLAGAVSIIWEESPGVIGGVSYFNSRLELDDWEADAIGFVEDLTVGPLEAVLFPGVPDLDDITFTDNYPGQAPSTTNQISEYEDDPAVAAVRDAGHEVLAVRDLDSSGLDIVYRAATGDVCLTATLLGDHSWCVTPDPDANVTTGLVESLGDDQGGGEQSMLIVGNEALRSVWFAEWTGDDSLTDVWLVDDVPGARIYVASTYSSRPAFGWFFNDGFGEPGDVQYESVERQGERVSP